MFLLVCAASLFIRGNAEHIVVSGESFYNYMRPYGSIRLEANGRGVYDDGGQYQVTISRDHKRVWVQTDTGDNPHDRGVELKCRKAGDKSR